MNAQEKKEQQLGLSLGKARHKLSQDLLWSFIVKTGQDCCYHCGQKMSRENFSLEHKQPWLDSGKAQELFFDLENVSFSHLSCNIRASRPNKVGNKGAKGWKKS